MNIWCISKYASLPKYGTGARLFFLAKEFKKLGHNVFLLTSDANHLAKFPETSNRYNFEKVDCVSVVWIKTKRYLKTASAARVLSWIDFEKGLFKFGKNVFKKPDVVIVSSLSLLSIVYGYFLKKKYRCFLIFEVRDIWPLTMTEEGGFSRWHPLALILGFIEKFGYKVSDLVVGTMPKLDLHVEKKLGYRRPFFCSPLGFNEEDYLDGLIGRQNPMADKFPVNKVIVGYAGSMGITNALEPFVECIEKLKNNQQIHFMLVGNGDLKEKLKEQLKGCENVTFLPRLKQCEIKYFLAHCDILYLSTKISKIWKYGQSMNKIVEYMLAGKPIIASYTGYPSMINEAGCGEFISATSAQEIKEVLLRYSRLEKSELEEIGQRGKTWIRARRTYRCLAKEYLTKIDQMMN